MQQAQTLRRALRGCRAVQHLLQHRLHLPTERGELKAIGFAEEQRPAEHRLKFLDAVVRAGWETWQCSAARVKLRACAAARK